MAITIERQQPERGDCGVAAAPAGQCCCCCCCCLHTVGSVIGAISARPRKLEPNPLPVAAIDGATHQPRYSATGLYWGLTALACFLTCLYFTVVEDKKASSDVVIVVLAILLPGAQLAASIVGAIVLGLSRRPDKDERLRHLGKITARALLGTLIGIAIMLPLLKC